jgi:hypothetical protein
MKPYQLFLWLACVALESLVLLRGWASQWLSKYPFFSAYLACVFIQDIFFLVIYLFHFKYYAPIYWYGEFFSLFLGCCVAWEIFHLVLGGYPGAGRMARNVLLFTLIVVFTKGLADAWNGNVPWPSTELELERNLRAIQALSLIVLAVLSAYYKIPIGRNVKGIFGGYGLFIASSVITLTLRTSLGKTFQSAWVFLQPLCYVAVLGVWCNALWKYGHSPQLEPRAKIENDYQSIVVVTRKGLVQARSFLGKTMRP